MGCWVSGRLCSGLPKKAVVEDVVVLDGAQISWYKNVSITPYREGRRQVCKGISPFSCLILLFFLLAWQAVPTDRHEQKVLA